MLAVRLEAAGSCRVAPQQHRAGTLAGIVTCGAAVNKNPVSTAHQRAGWFLLLISHQWLQGTPVSRVEVITTLMLCFLATQRHYVQVESIVISIIAMLSSPNDESPANVDAAKQWREDRDGFKKKVARIVRKSQENFD